MSSQVDQKAKRRHEMELQKSLIHTGKFPTCVTCKMLENEVCKRFNSRPPLAWVVTGCENYEQDIPF